MEKRLSLVPWRLRAGKTRASQKNFGTFCQTCTLWHNQSRWFWPEIMSFRSQKWPNLIATWKVFSFISIFSSFISRWRIECFSRSMQVSTTWTNILRAVFSSNAPCFLEYSNKSIQLAGFSITSRWELLRSKISKIWIWILVFFPKMMQMLDRG